MNSSQEKILNPEQNQFRIPSPYNSFFVITLLSASVSLHNFCGLLLILPSLYLSDPFVLRLSYFISTLTSNSISTLLLNFYLHQLTNHVLIEFILFELTKTYMIGFTLESVFCCLFLSCISFVIQKDLNNLNLLSSIFNESYRDKKNICDSMDSIALFITGEGKIVKFNKAAKKMFGELAGKDFFELISPDKVERVKNMIQIAIQNKVPEVDFNHFFPTIGKMNFVLSVKYVALEYENLFLISLDHTNISAKKRKIVLNSYQENFALQAKVQKKFLKVYSNTKKIPFKSCCLLMNYIYSQQETINITEMVVGQVELQFDHFDLKLEISNCIHFYWETLAHLSVSFDLTCENFPTFCGARIKHHLLIKSLLYFTSSTVEPSTSIQLKIKHSKNRINEIIYTHKYNSTKLTLDDLNQVFLLDTTDIDAIISIEKKYSLTVSLFHWLLRSLNGKIHDLSIDGTLVSVQFSLQFAVGNADYQSQVYFMHAFNKSNLHWPLNLEISKIFVKEAKMPNRIMSICATEVISEEVNEDFEDELSSFNS